MAELFMRALLRTLIVVLVCLALASPVGAARRGDRPTRRELQRRADRAAVRYDRAVAVLSRLTDDLARFERRIAAAEGEMAPLRDSVTRRAVAVYIRDRALDAVSGFATGADPLASARGVRLASEASGRDFAALEVLGEASGELARRRDELAARRADQKRVADELETERHNVELALSFLMRRQGSLQSRRVPRAGRQRVPVDGSRPSGPIPVVTDFICPIRGPLTFTDTWGAPRSGGRRHAGTDLMSPYGTENVAVVSGSIRAHRSGSGGLAIYLDGDDGHTYYYAHLAQFVGPDRRVAQGEVIGRTGSSGNAQTPHTHFEFHPGGGRAVNSYPLVKAHC